MILGLDISTSILGYSILDAQGKIAEIGHWNFTNKNKFPTFFSKVLEAREQLDNLTVKYPIDHIFIEPALNMFMAGKSSAHTISTLTKFNGIVSWLCYEMFGIDPEYIPAATARKKCGIKIPKGAKAKQCVIKYVLDNVPDVSIEYTKHGNPKPHCFDKADSWVIAKAGWLDCQNKEK